MLLVAFRESQSCSSIEETAATLYPLLPCQGTQQDLLEQLHHMDDAGHRYKNIEKSLGTGSCLVLGTDIAETTSVLSGLPPKSAANTNQMDQVVAQERT